MATSDLIETAIRAAASDLVMQGNLIFNREYGALMETLLRHAPAGMENCWLSLSGADANENALKLVRQQARRAPRGDRVSRMLSRADQRDGGNHRPSRLPGGPAAPPFRCTTFPFTTATTPTASPNRWPRCSDVIAREGERIAAFIVELVQGEAGFVTAPREFFVPLFEECRRAAIPIWVDEVQTFARTGELFATDLLNLADYVDVITDRQGLPGQRRSLSARVRARPRAHLGNLLGRDGGDGGRAADDRADVRGAMFGPEGRERELERLTREHLRILAERHPGVVSEVDGVGAMLSFRVGDGTLETTRAFIRRCFDAGLVLYYGGHEPACVRLFVPAAVVTNDELTDAFTILDRCMD